MLYLNLHTIKFINTIMLGSLLIMMITSEELVLGVVMYTIVVSATGNIN